MKNIQRSCKKSRLMFQVVLLGLVLVVSFPLVYWNSWIKNSEVDIVNARANFPAIQAELEDGITQLQLIVEWQKDASFLSAYMKRDRESYVEAYGLEAVEIAERLMKVGKFSDIYYYTNPLRFCFALETTGSKYVYYYYQEDNPNYKEQLVGNWYLDYADWP